MNTGRSGEFENLKKFHKPSDPALSPESWVGCKQMKE